MGRDRQRGSRRRAHRSAIRPAFANAKVGGVSARCLDRCRHSLPSPAGQNGACCHSIRRPSPARPTLAVCNRSASIRFGARSHQWRTMIHLCLRLASTWIVLARRATRRTGPHPRPQRGHGRLGLESRLRQNGSTTGPWRDRVIAASQPHAASPRYCHRASGLRAPSSTRRRADRWSARVRNRG